MIPDSRRRLWKQRLTRYARIAFFAVIAFLILLLIPPDLPRRMDRKRDKFIEFMKTKHPQVYNFITNKDMDWLLLLGDSGEVSKSQK